MGMLVLVILVLISSVLHISSPCCEKKERITTLLDTAMDLISKVKMENISCTEENITNNINKTCGAAADCADLFKRGLNKSGVYTIQPNSRLTSLKRSLDVYCDMTTDGGGWTIIQRRGDFGRVEDFDRDWVNYKKGFGDIEKEFWLGNDNIFALTNQKLYSVRFDLEDKRQDTAFARYDNFWIDDEFNNFTLHISGYNGTAGNSMERHNEAKFSTKDRYNDVIGKNCASTFKSGWWFIGCHFANLNGKHNATQTNGIFWNKWRSEENLPKAEIKIRPFIF